MTTVVFTSSGIFSITGSNISCSISVWGAGAAGSISGNGGSGGAFASSSLQLSTGVTYSASVGLGGTFTSGNGQTSSFSGSGAYVSAAGGFQNGTVTSQSGSSSGSIYYNGGVGGAYYTGSGNSNGSGGGSVAGPFSPGAAGYSGTGLNVLSRYNQGAFGGAGPTSGSNPSTTWYITGSALVGTNYFGNGTGSYYNGAGGSGSFYYAGPGTGFVKAGTNGVFPGGGGGGAYQDNAGSTVQCSYASYGNLYFPPTTASIQTAVFSGTSNQPSGSGQIITTTSSLVGGPIVPNYIGNGANGLIIVTF